MQLTLRKESVRTEFLAALAGCGFVNRAAARAGIGVSAVGRYRRRHPEFDAAVAAGKLADFDQRFHNLWRYYLMYCEGGFRERSIGVAHLLLAKPGYRGGSYLPGLLEA